MATTKRLVWDAVGERNYEAGVDQGVLYTRDKEGNYPQGYAWNGLTAINEAPSGAEPSPFYANNSKYITMMSAEEYNATIEAYTYPDEFKACDGSLEVSPGLTIGQQDRLTFGLSYRTLVGNDVEMLSYGYKLHLVYGCLAAPSGKDHGTINDSPDIVTFSWEVSTTPVPLEGYKPTATMEIDSKVTGAVKMKKIEDILYGTETEEPRLPSPLEVINILKEEDPDGPAQG